MQAIRLYIGTFTMGRKQCTDVYPDQKRMIDQYEDAEQAVMFIDAGGGFGHQAKLLKDEPGRVVVQDLAQMKGGAILRIEF